MNIWIIVIILLLLVGGGGWGYGTQGWGAHPIGLYGGPGLILLIVVLFLLFR